ncbi:hypothetical protein [Mucilaginibacter pedocola]|uniref:DUF4352 domain-containing protein n=1 Tax=Mucilaginibacter pedocola TaxID=1792845 RepID=A0A1S9PNJ1_9SPHI|nr:hypothetical protein [Mucilaginibacter pedocola]OOQ62138.1 hypothetical protein BC343_03550 [Mucilaginibacter pedocola]
MNIKKLSILSIALAIFLSSCSNPLNRKYSDATMIDDVKAIRESNKLDTAELSAMALYVVGAKFTGENLEGKTYQEILDSAREAKKKRDKQEAEEKALAAKAEAEEKAKAEQFNKILTVAVYDKGYEEADYEDYITYKISFQNKGSKDIRAFKGSLTVTDLFDSEIKSFNMTMDDGVKAGATFSDTYTTKYNQFMDEDVRLKNKDFKDLKFSFKPLKVIFADGTTLE